MSSLLIALLFACKKCYARKKRAKNDAEVTKKKLKELSVRI